MQEIMIDHAARKRDVMAVGGKIDRGEARDNAFAAGECLKIALQ